MRRRPSLLTSPGRQRRGPGRRDFIRLWDIFGRVLNYKTAIFQGGSSLGIGWMGNSPSSAPPTVTCTASGESWTFPPARSSTIYTLTAPTPAVAAGAGMVP